ncbi:MAG: hypothetical protein LBD99_06245, partial [Candidatus Margulisbacteria bacterium]|nr:hypothetical protein [Candidatus Margulisiibacteriota bacterium]
ELDADIVLNAVNASGAAPKLKPHRLWARLKIGQGEMRAGLQKINFGSAVLFRPLQWFDAIDPLDPLGYTEGVKGILARYYLPNNANFWLWGLAGSDELKGAEIIPTAKYTGEFGGRLQLPVFNGEAGLTYHQRRIDFGASPTFSLLSDEITAERRVGLDGKWDTGIGVWFEAAHSAVDIDQQDSQILRALAKQRLFTIGADYTFALGNGLHMLVEKFNQDSSLEVKSENINSQIYGIMADYPLNLYDTVSVLQYYAANTNQTRFSWQRTLDDFVWQILLAHAPGDSQQDAIQFIFSYNY